MTTEHFSPAPGKVLRAVTLGLAGLLVLPGALAVTLYAAPQLQLAHPALTLAASFIPYGILAWLAATLLVLVAARRRARLLALLTFGGLVLQVAWARPYWPIPATPAPVTAADVTVMSINLRCDGVGLEELAAHVARVQPDILVLQGADPETQDYFLDDGWPGERPNRAFFPLDVDPECGKLVLSNHPIVDATAPGGWPVVRVAMPDLPLTVIPVDTPTPLEGLDVWEGALRAIQETATTHLHEPTLVIGDFNAVLEHLPLRRMLDGGLADAAAETGAGWRPTFPANRTYPPVIAIDHALVSPSLQASAVATFQAGINAHRGITVHLESD